VHRAGSLQWAGLVAVAIAAVVADQVTKRAIEHRLALDEAHHVLPGLTITHVRNSGIAFGIFPGKLAIVSVLTAAAVVWMLVHFARSGSRHVLFPVALGLLVGGSVSNLADSFIVIGVALLALGLIRVEHRKSQAPVDPDPSAGLDRP